MSKARLLSKLDRKMLLSIVEWRGISVSRRARTKTLVKELSKQLTTREIECSIMIFKLLELKGQLRRIILKPVARIYGSPIIMEGSLAKTLMSLSYEPLKALYEAFVERKYDKNGYYLEFRTAAWIARKWGRKLADIRMRYEVENVGELDIVGLNKCGNIVCIAECKGRDISRSDVDTWIENTKRLLKKYPKSFREAYMISSKKYSKSIINRVKTMEGVNPVTGAIGIKLRGRKRKVYARLEMYRETAKKFYRVFPKT